MDDRIDREAEESQRTAISEWLDETERERHDRLRPWNRPDGVGERWRAAAAKRARRQHADRRLAKKEAIRLRNERFPRVGRTAKKGMGLRREILHFWPDDGGWYPISEIAERVENYELRSVEVEIRKMFREGLFERKPEKRKLGRLHPEGCEPFSPVGVRFLYRLQAPPGS